MIAAAADEERAIQPYSVGQVYFERNVPCSAIAYTVASRVKRRCLVPTVIQNVREMLTLCMAHKVQRDYREVNNAKVGRAVHLHPVNTRCVNAAAVYYDTDLESRVHDAAFIPWQHGTGSGGV